MSDIFISYSRKDKDWIKTLTSALEAEGYDVWWDPKILPGQDYERVIKTALKRTRCVLTVWSENSIQSQWVKAEAQQGYARKIYVPMLYQQVEVPMQFRHIHSASLIDWQGKTDDLRYQKLLQAIALKVKPSSNPKKPDPDPIQRYVLWLIISVVLLGSLTFYYKQQKVEADPKPAPNLSITQKGKELPTQTNKPKDRINTDQSYKAYFNLGKNYYYGQNKVKIDYKKAFEYFQKAADQGYDPGQFYLGLLYQKGYGAKQDYKKAAELYQKAADQGNSNAQYNLAWLYKEGKGVKQDYKKAFELYQKLADQNDAYSKYNLGLLYEQGYGVKQDYKKAAELYQKAVDQGIGEALLHLDRLKEVGKARNN